MVKGIVEDIGNYALTPAVNALYKFGKQKLKDYVGSKSNLSSKVARLDKKVRKVKCLLDSEKHYNDNASSAEVNTGGSFIRLTNIAQGDTNITRSGQQINVNSVLCNIYMQIDAAATFTLLRCILLVDTEFDGTAPTLAEILESTGYPITSPLNKDNTPRFKILRDKLITGSSTGNKGQSIQFYKYFKKPLKVKYSSTTDAAADARQNQIYLLLLSNEADNGPTVNTYSRVLFTG